jgi:hypothetical protein
MWVFYYAVVGTYCSYLVLSVSIHTVGSTVSQYDIMSDKLRVRTGVRTYVQMYVTIKIFILQ